MILALETATNVCSVAFQDRKGRLFERRTERRGSHSEQLFLFVEELMKEHGFRISDLDALLVSEGPGSFTGLRISASAVKGLLFLTGVPLYAVNTLAGFARSAVDADPGLQAVHSVIDARRVHLYHQKFGNREGSFTAETEVQVLPIDKVQAMIRREEGVVGTGINRMDDMALAGSKIFAQQYITAEALIHLYEQGNSPFVRQVDPEKFDPEYYTSRQVER